METNTAPGGVQPAGDSTALLAEFGRWLGRERGLSLVSVQCYSKQSKAFLTWIGGAGAVSGRDTAMGLRDYAILSLLARLGLRGAEAAGLQLGDIDWRAGEITVTGKGSR